MSEFFWDLLYWFVCGVGIVAGLAVVGFFLATSAYLVIHTIEEVALEMRLRRYDRRATPRYDPTLEEENV